MPAATHAPLSRLVDIGGSLRGQPPPRAVRDHGPAICHALDPTRSFLMGAPRNRAINPFSVALRGPQIFLRVECFLADYPAASAAGRRSDCPVRGGRDGCQTALRSRKFPWSRDPERTRP
jgi:hypothetical protein